MPAPYLTTVILCRNVACDINNADIVNAGGVAQWLGYCRSRAKQTYTELSYQREGGFIRLPEPIDYVRDCNYIAYQNGDMSERWFFAFIARMEYVNDEMTNVYIKDDIFQTWQDDLKFLPCYIERMHSKTDERGDNLLEDNLATGEYVIDGVIGNLWNDFSIIIGTTQTLWDATEVVAGTYLNNMFSGIKLYRYDMSAPGARGNFVISLQLFARNGHMDAIKFMYMVPNEMLTGGFDSPAPVGEKTISGVFPTTVDGYDPRNKKLLTYPYVACTASNLCGNATEYRYEFFSSSSPTFGYRGSITSDGRIMVYPKFYKKQINCFDESLLCSSYPRISWNGGGYEQWSAVQSIKYDAEDKSVGWNKIGSFVSSAVSMGASALTGNVMGMVSSGVSLFNENIVGDMNRSIRRDMEGEVAALTPPSVRGLVGADSTLVENGMFGFVVYAKSIRAEVARCIDDYWDMYGYPCRRVLVPEIRYRPHWNYVKTVGCKVTGLPPTEAAEFEAMMDAGVRFWRDPVDFCDYTQDNRV